MKKQTKIALVCSMGGHFEQLTNLSEFYEQHDHFWITNKTKQTESQLEKETKYFIYDAHYKKPWTYLYQVPFVIKAFVKEKPTHVLSTGSGTTGLIPFLFAKTIGIKFMYIDTFSRVNGYSKFGSFLLKLGHPMFTQWEDTNKNKAIFIGPIFKNPTHATKNKSSNYVFVTVGTREEPFKRLIKIVESLVKKGTIQEKVIVQAGNTSYDSHLLEIFDFCAPNNIDDLILNAKYVITQESAGIGTKCLKYDTKFIVMPRDYRYGELIAKSDMKEDLHVKLEELGYTKVVNNREDLANAISQIDTFKSGFKFDNELAISTLNRLMEGI